MTDYIFTIAILSVLSLCFEHPFDVMKTWWQAYPGLASMRIVAGKIYDVRGFYGFYSGFVPNMIRILSKQFYRYPLMILLPVFYKSALGDLWFISFLCALTIACFEILVITPLEHLKVRFILIFYKTNPQNGLYRGAPIVAIRQIVSWVSFLCAQDFFSHACPHTNIILIGIMVGSSIRFAHFLLIVSKRTFKAVKQKTLFTHTPIYAPKKGSIKVSPQD